MPIVEVYASWWNGEKHEREFVGSVSCPMDGWVNMRKRNIDPLAATMERAAHMETERGIPSKEYRPVRGDHSI